MARSKGSFGLAGAVEPKAAAPLDARAVVKNMGELTAVGSFPYPYVGMETYVVSENKKYRLIGNDPTVPANWEEIGAGGTGGGHTIEDPEGTALTQRNTLQFGGDLEVSDDDENEKTVVAPHELTAAELTEIMSTLPGQPTQGITIDLRGNEQVVGKVIESDGTEKTLYQNTVNCGALPNNGDKTVNHNVTNIDKIYKIWGIGISSSDSSPIPYYMPTATGIGCYVNKTAVCLQTARNLSSLNGLITFQYTKTTS